MLVQSPCCADRTLGQRVFSRPGQAAKEEDGWRDSLYRVYKSGQQSMRVAVYGCKHDAAMFEILLKEYCTFDQPGLSGDSMIDTACLSTPKVQQHFLSDGTAYFQIPFFLAQEQARTSCKSFAME